MEFANRQIDQIDQIADVNTLHEAVEAHSKFLKVMLKNDDAARTDYVGTDQD